MVVAQLALGQSASRKAETMQSTTPHPTSLTPQQFWRLDKVYTDEEHAVSFRYPSAWRSTNQFGYHAPMLTAAAASGEAKMTVTGFGFGEGDPAGNEGPHGAYAGTNLEGFGMVYGVEPARSAAECDARAASYSDVPKGSVIAIAGRAFVRRKVGDAGMSQTESGNLYSTYAEHSCYLFETDTVTSGAALDNPSTSPVPQGSIDAHLFRIVQSIRIKSTAGAR